MVALREHFSRDDRSRHSEWLRQRQWFIKAREDRQRRDEIADRLEDDLVSMATDVILATEAQIREFEARLDIYEARLDGYDQRLDAYDRAVTEALIRNSERLALLEQQIADSDATLFDMLSKAHVMEDGRRVFKSEDGSFVVDEHGDQVGAEEIDFDLIDGPTSAETFVGALERDKALKAEHVDALEERQQLHDAQAEIDTAREKSAAARTKLDDARERISEGELTLGEIEDLDAELEELMPKDMPTLPIAAAKRLSNSADASSLKGEFSGPAQAARAPELAATKAAPAAIPELEM